LVDLNTSEAQVLRQRMADALEAYLNAHANYQRALVIAADTEQNSDGILAFWQAGRLYTEALSRHTSATIEWLIYVDKLLRTPHSKGKGGGE